MDPHALHRLLLQCPNRRRIYETVVAMPGIHMRELSRRLELALGSVEHHLRQLEKHGLVFAHQGGRRHAYFAMGQVDEDDAKILHGLRKPLWSRLVRTLLAGRPCGVSTLAFQVNEPVTTVSYALRRMRDAGWLERMQVGRESVYVLREPDRVEAVLEAFPTPGQGIADAAFAGLVDRAARPIPEEEPLLASR